MRCVWRSLFPWVLVVPGLLEAQQVPTMCDRVTTARSVVRALADRDSSAVVEAFDSTMGRAHLFLAGQGKSTTAEYQIAGHVAEAVIDDIASWIHP